MKLVDVDSIQIEIKRPRMDGKYSLTEALVKALEKTIRELPAADAVLVRHAALLDAHPIGECSLCGFLIDSRANFKYCPGCGAKMDGGKK
jgi:NADH pyrophosphatase NudC (nudix superfamily)